MEQFRDLMDERWREFDRAASAVGEGGNMVSVLAGAWYRTLEPIEQRVADRVLSDWVLVDSPRRGPVLALIWDARIRSTEPALRQLVTRLDRVSGPSAKDLREKVQRILEALKGGAP